MAALSLSLRNLTRAYGTAGVRDLSLEIRAGEGFSILGPSGCGKTTMLRLIAGFETPDSGTVSLGGRDITALPPQKRDIRTVFQRYALFPHLNVFENVAFGLRMRRVSEPELRRRVDAVIELTNIGPLRARQVTGLSGGEQQRVALARALVNEPAVMLLDEPLSALDLKLRERMQSELLSLRRRLGKTFVFVTHDQGEAMFLSDRIAILNQGHLEQAGTPQEIYNRPRTAFVASFIGHANFLGSETVTALEGARDSLPTLRSGERWMIRPERLRMLCAQENLRDGEISMRVRVGESVFLGQDRLTHLKGPNDIEITMRRPGFEPVPGAEGTDITVTWEASNTWKIADTAAR